MGKCDNDYGHIKFAKEALNAFLYTTTEVRFN